MNDRIDSYNARRNIENKKKKEKRRRRLVSSDFKEKARSEDKCRNPNCVRTRAYWKLHAHHIVHRSSFNPYDPDRDNPNNAMALCFECHTEYHNGRLATERSWLTEDEVDFVLQHAGKAWLDKVYPKDRGK